MYKGYSKTNKKHYKSLKTGRKESHDYIKQFVEELKEDS